MPITVHAYEGRHTTDQSLVDASRRGRGAVKRGASREYQRLMRKYRETRSRPDVGLNPLPGRQGPTKLRQPDVDEALRCGAGVYQKVESGRLRPSPELFLRIAQTLGFSAHDRRVAHLDLFDSEPPPAVREPRPYWQCAVDGQREMTCVLAPDGQLVAYNAAFAAMFGDRGVPPDFWRWALLSDHARNTSLIDWETAWAPYLVEECRLLSLRYRGSPVIRRLCTDLADDPRLQSLSRADSDLNGCAGSVWHSQKGISHVRVLAAESEGFRVLTFLARGE
ncbi:helix-turn-helix domain-containing protein [Streptomyces sp. NPDC028722]|uniref:helix-turn-helix domain-containing protein n=1 Tax=Streptomyces sp. NPDC028722 TaxID=3155016 RepID=UPI0033BFCEDB